MRPTDSFWFSVVGLSFLAAVASVVTSVVSLVTTRERADRRALAAGLLGLAVVAGCLVTLAFFGVQIVRALLSFGPVR